MRPEKLESYTKGRNQLRLSALTLTETLHAPGFYDQSHFSHLFKEHTGFTPAEFRAFSGSASRL